jgi:hypothetical protein
MAIVQSLLALVTRSFGRLLSALFGWAVVALFGDTSPKEKTWLSVLVAAAAGWPLLVLGVIWPRLAALVLAFVPLPEWISDNTIRAVWIALAVAVPFSLGIAVASRSRGAKPPIPGSAPPPSTSSTRVPPPTPLSESKVTRLLRGFPITLAVAAAFFVVFVTVPVRRLVTVARRRVEVQVPLITDAEGYRTVANKVADTLISNGMPVGSVDPPWWLTAPGRILVRLGGPSFRDYVPAQLACFRGAELDVILYPNSLSLTGSAQTAAWAHGLVVEALTAAPAYQTFDPEAQDIERQIRSVWAVYSQYPRAHVDAPRLRARLEEIARDIRRLPVDYEQWQIVYRQALQLDRALDGRPQLLEAQTNGKEEAVLRPAADSAAAAESAKLRALSTRALVREISDKAALLARKEVQLATAEVKSDLRSELGMAKGLTIGGLAALLGLNVLLLAAAVAVASVMPAWIGAMLMAAVLIGVGAALGYRSWTRRPTPPLALTRRMVRETTRWAKDLVGRGKRDRVEST